MRRIVLGIGTIALGVLLLAMAVPRLIANLALQPGNTAGRAVFGGGLLSAPSYDRLLGSRRAALEWVELPEARLELGGALYRMAQSADELHVDVEPTLREAAADIERGLT